MGIRNTALQQYNASFVNVAWPSGTVAGDTVVMLVETAYNTSTPSGWTNVYGVGGTAANGLIIYRTLNATDITTGYVTVGAAGSYFGVAVSATWTGPATVTASGGSWSAGSSPSVTLSSGLASGYVAIHMAGGRNAFAITPSRGSMLQSNVASEQTGALYAETLTSTASITTAFNTANTGSGVLVGSVVLVDFTYDQFLSDTISLSDSAGVNRDLPNRRFRKCALTIQHGQVSDDQTAFPVLITQDCLPAEMVTLGGSCAAQSDGGDIRFSSDSAGFHQLACEIVIWAQNANPALALVEIWVSVNVLTASDVTIYVWYIVDGGGSSQPAASATLGSQAVWPNSTYKTILHMNEATNAQALDSTANALHSQTNVSTRGTGKFGYCQTFNGSSEVIVCHSLMTEPAGAVYTISCWQKASAANFSVITDPRSTGFGILVYTIQTTGVAASFSNPGGSISSTAVAADSTWHYIVATSNGSSQKIYVDNNAAVSGSFTPQTWAGGVIARDYTGAYYAQSTQEFRLRNIEVSANWIKTEFNNQNSPSTFIVAGTPSGSCGAFVNPDPIFDSISLSDSAIRFITGSSTTLIGDLISLVDSSTANFEFIISPPVPLHEFEFYGMETPADVEILPVPKKYDQVGPVRFDKIGKIFGFRVRLIASGITTIMPYKIFGDDSESLNHLNSPLFFDSFVVRPGLDNVYEIQLPKSVNTDICRMTFGPVDDPFYRYDVLIKVHISGMKGQAKWIPIR